MIEINDVSKMFGEFAAVDNVNLKIQDGEFLGLLGPNGAGKTTIIKMLTGLLKPTTGTIYVDGEKMSRNNMKIKKRIGVVPQYTNLDKELTAYENLIFAAKLFKIKDYKNKIEELLTFMELEKHKNKKAMNLSGGMERRLMIAKALINDPDIIFLDEPTVGIDLNGRRKIWDILKGMKAMGKTVLFTTHYIEEADYLCNQVCLINNGRVFKKETPEKLKNDLGIYTVEYFDSEMKTNYEYFKDKDGAEKYISSIEYVSYTIRKTTLEDVFYNFTNRKVV
ncbi:ABC transporter ATP-binding protein [Sporanaerobacter acetigenes]|uniref:ABC-2 type transport system ATP-binding protein n=1 Tax=Sporanaerobacter acetigenes DSM 13106 TaxID=1123281 RepID=A0A1M5YF56_9FIRM|nr:ABC transporter ATP-binding protein [Sporanaerobacter acetigenes]SHI10534.1 ABC-2 type transport system ATP-binding protein [Sporanaerobacter acetigenes DSM 13106]